MRYSTVTITKTEIKNNKTTKFWLGPYPWKERTEKFSALLKESDLFSKNECVHLYDVNYCLVIHELFGETQ